MTAIRVQQKSVPEPAYAKLLPSHKVPADKSAGKLKHIVLQKSLAYPTESLKLSKFFLPGEMGNSFQDLLI